MPKAADLKKGHIVQINSQPYIVSQIEVKSPSSRSGTTLYKVRFNHVQTKQKLDQSFTGDDVLTFIDFQKRPVQFLYLDADGYTFMDNEDFAQFALNAEQLEDQLPYLHDGIEGLYGLLVEGNLRRPSRAPLPAPAPRPHALPPAWKSRFPSTWKPAKWCASTPSPANSCPAPDRLPKHRCMSVQRLRLPAH